MDEEYINNTGVELMTADEAYEAAKIESDIYNKELNKKVKEQIEETVEGGDFTTLFYYYELTDEMYYYLIQLGYIVETVKNDNYYRVSWSKNND